MDFFGIAASASKGGHRGVVITASKISTEMFLRGRRRGINILAWCRAVAAFIAEPNAAPDRGRHPGFARHKVSRAAPAGELGRSAAEGPEAADRQGAGFRPDLVRDGQRAVSIDHCPANGFGPAAALICPLRNRILGPARGFDSSCSRPCRSAKCFYSQR